MRALHPMEVYRAHIASLDGTGFVTKAVAVAALPEWPGHWFTWDEVRCRHSDELPPVEVLRSAEFARFVQSLDVVREAVGFALPVNSWYRCAEHPNEIRKSRTGAHRSGLAVDIGVSGEQAFVLVRELWSRLAVDFGADSIGLGFMQRGPARFRFVHVDVAVRTNEALRSLRPRIWSY